MLFIRILIVGYVVIEICSSETSVNHHRSKRIANRRRHRNHGHRNGTKKAKHSGVTVNPLQVSEESTGYPEDYFLPPGATEIIDTYDYDRARYNKPYLTQAEWRDDITNRTRHYKKKAKEESGGIQVASIIKPVEPIAPIEAIEPIKGLSFFR